MISKGNRTIPEETYNTFKTLTKRSYNLGIISNTISKTQNIKEFKKAGIYKYLKSITLSSDTGIIKPDPEIFNIALCNTNATAEKSAYVGNKSVNDIETARKAGFKYCIYLNYKEKEDISTFIKLPKVQQADAYITEIQDLLELFI